MSNHPNRSRALRPGRNPTTAEITRARERAGLTQAQAAAIVYRSLRTWQDWEGGQRRMPPDTWEYWCLLQSVPAVARAREVWLEVTK